MTTNHMKNTGPMKNTGKRLAWSALCGGLLLLTACPKPVEEVVVVEEPAITDIPGVDPAAVAKFNDGLKALEEVPTNYEGALSSFEGASEIDPDFWEAFQNIGLIQMDLAMYREAAATFRKTQSLIDDLIARGWPVAPRPEILLDLGKALALSGDVNGAAEALGALVAADPKNSEARANLAALNLQSNNPDASRAFIAELLKATQNDVGALNVLALIYKKQGDMQMAAYLWEKCIGEVEGARAWLENEEQYEGLTPEQRTRLEDYNRRRADRMVKMLGDIQNELGIVEYAKGNADSAESFFRQAVQNNPNNAAARTNLGAVYLEYAAWSMACEEFAQALALRPREHDAMVGKGACLYGQGDADGAYAAYEAAAASYDGDAFIASQLGEIAYRDKNDQELAARWLLKNLELRGMNPSSCDRRADNICALYNSILEMRNSAEPTEPGN